MKGGHDIDGMARVGGLQTLMGWETLMGWDGKHLWGRNGKHEVHHGTDGDG